MLYGDELVGNEPTAGQRFFEANLGDIYVAGISNASAEIYDWLEAAKKEQKVSDPAAADLAIGKLVEARKAALAAIAWDI